LSGNPRMTALGISKRVEGWRLEGKSPFDGSSCGCLHPCLAPEFCASFRHESVRGRAISGVSQSVLSMSESPDSHAFGLAFAEEWCKCQRPAGQVHFDHGTRGHVWTLGPPSSSLALVFPVRHRDCAIGGSGGPWPQGPLLPCGRWPCAQD
jgi:hypothetical protein